MPCVNIIPSPIYQMMTGASPSAPTSNTMAPLNAVSGESQSFAFLEYYLRLSLHAGTVKILNAWEVSNPQLTLQFEKRAKESLTLDAWLDAGSLAQAAPGGEEEVIRKGFQFTATSPGMKFTVGRIPQAQDEQQHQESGVIRRRMLLCKIAVGRAYNATEDFAKIAAIPEGYDSFVLDRECVALQRVPEASAIGNGESHSPVEYILKEATQILPTFVVTFEYDPELERRSRQKSTCDNCEAAPATVFCQADSANLCAGCDASLHATKLTARHVRAPLEAGPQTFSTCRHHPDKLVEFFCPTCSRPVCVHCKMVGHHSTGDTARHKLITVAEAFRGVSEAARAADPLLEARKQRINAQMGAVVERARAVEANAHEVQQQLEEIYRKATADLKSITKRKLNILKGDMLELHREAGEINQLESFLHYQASGGNATQFILDWASHQRLRGELHAFPYFRETIDVHPDIKINGGIQVHIEAAGLPPLAPAYELSGGDSPMRASTLFDRPRYAMGGTGSVGHSPGRSRAGTPTVDFSSLTKTPASNLGKI